MKVRSKKYMFIDIRNVVLVGSLLIKIRQINATIDVEYVVCDMFYTDIQHIVFASEPHVYF